MRKWFAFLLVLPALCLAQSMNTTCYTDTTVFTGFKGTDSAYGKVTKLQDYENISIWVAAADTTNAAAGFADDSCHMLIGYRLGSTCYNANGKKDTTWRGIFVVDSFRLKLGQTLRGDSLYYYDDGSEPSTAGQVDTSKVTGWATMIVPVTPTASELFQGVQIGRAGNKATAKLINRMAYIRRIGQRVSD